MRRQGKQGGSIARAEAAPLHQQPAGGKPNVVLRVDYLEGKQSVGWIEIAKIDNASGPSDDVAPIEAFVRTERTASWAKIHSANQLIADAQKLIAAP